MMRSFFLHLLPLLLFAPSVLANPCDIFAATGTPCVAAHSMVRALYANYSGPLYQLRRQADNATQDIFPLTPGGIANATAHDLFCQGPPSQRQQPLGMPPIGYTVNIIPASLSTLSFRHCYSQAFVTPTDGNADHQFKLVPALNGNPNAISFQSLNYPTSYIAPVTTAEPGRLGIVETPPVPDDASWVISDAPGGNGQVIITLPNRGNLSMVVGTNLTGICAASYTPPSASVYLGLNNNNDNENINNSAAAAIWILNSTGYPPPATCQVWRFYDQSPNHNDLQVAGPAINNPADDNPCNATRHPIVVKGGQKVYGAMFETGMGYRVANTTNVSKGNEPETLYMVTSGQYVNDGCCFDYGNAESDPTNSSTFADGTMEAINFSNSQVSGYWCGGAGTIGPYIFADLENGLWACGTPGFQNNNNTALPFAFVTAMVKGGTDGFAIKGGDATSSTPLTTMYDGPRPPGYQPMKKQGAIILGMGGDNVDTRRKGKGKGRKDDDDAERTMRTTGRVDIPTTAIGIFYEGCITQGYSTDAADAAVQADIAALAYGQ